MHGHLNVKKKICFLCYNWSRIFRFDGQGVTETAETFWGWGNWHL